MGRLTMLERQSIIKKDKGFTFKIENKQKIIQIQ